MAIVCASMLAWMVCVFKVQHLNTHITNIFFILSKKIFIQKHYSVSDESGKNAIIVICLHLLSNISN